MEQNLELEPTATTNRAASRIHWWQQSETTAVRPATPSPPPPPPSQTPSPVRQAWRIVETVTPIRTAAVAPPAVTTVTAPLTAEVTPVVAAPPVLDIGEELEHEARQRSVAEARGERVVIYANNQQNIARLKKRMSYMAIPLALYGLLALWQPSLFLPIWCLLILECVGIYHWFKRVHARQTLPVVTLTQAGMEIHSIGHDLGLVRWDEIADIRAYNLLYRYVGITPRDSNQLCKRLNRRQRSLIKANEAVTPLYRLFRQFVAPINLAQQHLPISADALVAKIEAFRAAHRV